MATTPHFFGGDWSRQQPSSGASSPIPGFPRHQGGYGTGLGPGSDQDGSRRSSLFLDEARQFVEKGSHIIGGSNSQPSSAAVGARSISPNPAGTIGGHRSANTSRGVSPVNPYPPPSSKGDFRSTLAYNAFRSSSPSFTTAHSQQGSGVSEPPFDGSNMHLQQPSASLANNASRYDSSSPIPGDRTGSLSQYTTPRLNVEGEQFTDSLSQRMAGLINSPNPPPPQISTFDAGEKESATSAAGYSRAQEGKVTVDAADQGLSTSKFTSERDGDGLAPSDASGNSPRSHPDSLGPNRSLGSDVNNATGGIAGNLSRPSSIYGNSGPLPQTDSTASLPWRNGGSGLPQVGGLLNGSMTNLAGGLLAPNAVASNQPVPGSAGGTPHQQSTVAFPSVSSTYTDTGMSGDFDAALRNSPLVADLYDRLGRMEAGMKEVSRQMGGLTRNVSILLEKAKQGPLSPMPGNVIAHGQGQQQRHGGSDSGANTMHSADDVRALSSQLSTLSSSVAQLLAMQGGGGSIVVPSPQLLPTGGGLGGGYPPSHSSRRSPSPMAGHTQTFPNNLHAQDHGNRLSPHVGGHGPSGRMSWGGAGSIISGYGGGGPGSTSGSVHDGPANGYPRSGKDLNDRRWSSLNQSNVRRDSLGTPTIRAADNEGSGSRFAGGASSTDSSVVATKWEHLSLHTDLLRSIAKYGLGPPNKIQQRALPFLLRGNDIIAQAPPTQERIASYVIPVLQLVLTALREPNAVSNGVGRGPIALIISTTVDQATQAQRMVLGLGSGLGVRVHIAAAGSIDAHQEAAAVLQASPHIIVGTPRKMTELFQFVSAQGPGPNSVPMTDVRLVVLDEADQLIARNLSDYVSSLLRLLPLPRALQSSAASSQSLTPGLPQSSSFGAPDLSSNGGTMDRQTAIFSNTVPQDVLNFAQSIHLRESVRVLVRREGAGPVHSSSGLGGSAGQSQSGGLTSHQQSGPPSNAMGATPMNANANPMADPIISSLRGLRQYYLYVAVSGNAPGMNPSGFGNAATEMKLDVITDLLEDIDFGQAVIYCESSATLESVTYKVASKGIEALALHKDMANVTRQQVLAKFRSATPTPGFGAGPFGAPAVGRGRKALIVYDVAINPKDVHQVPLIVFYDLPRSVDEYKEKIACAAAGGAARPSVCVNVVTASGGPRGDIEMLRTLECHLGCKMAELPMDPKQILHF